MSAANLLYAAGVVLAILAIYTLYRRTESPVTPEPTLPATAPTLTPVSPENTLNQQPYDSPYVTPTPYMPPVNNPVSAPAETTSDPSLTASQPSLLDTIIASVSPAPEPTVITAEPTGSLAVPVSTTPTSPAISTTPLADVGPTYSTQPTTIASAPSTYVEPTITTVQPTTVQPTTVQPTTVQPTTVQPIVIDAAPSTNPSPSVGTTQPIAPQPWLNPLDSIKNLATKLVTATGTTPLYRISFENPRRDLVSWVKGSYDAGSPFATITMNIPNNPLNTTTMYVCVPEKPVTINGKTVPVPPTTHWYSKGVPCSAGFTPGTTFRVYNSNATGRTPFCVGYANNMSGERILRGTANCTDTGLGFTHSTTFYLPTSAS